MTKREKFINFIDKEIFENDGLYGENYPEDWEDFCDFWKSFKAAAEKSSGPITEKGKQILDFMFENREKFNNDFKAKDVAEGLFTSSRSVSGSMRKLVEDGYVLKTPGEPIIYHLSDKKIDK